MVFNGDYQSLEAVAAERRINHENAELPLTILSEETITLASGLQAVRWRLDSQMAGRSTEIVTVIDGRMIIFGGLGDQMVMDAIAATLQKQP